MQRKDFQNMDERSDIENIMSVCGAIPHGDELPQAPGLQDILMDVYSDALNLPREYAAARFHHQFDDDLDLDYEDIIH